LIPAQENHSPGLCAQSQLPSGLFPEPDICPCNQYALVHFSILLGLSSLILAAEGGRIREPEAVPVPATRAIEPS